MVTSPLLVVGNNQPVTVTMTVSAEGSVSGLTPPASLSINADSGITAVLTNGPIPAGPVSLNGSVGSPDSIAFTYTYDVSAGTQPGDIAFSGKPTGSATFVQATSNSTLVTPPLQFKVQVKNGAPNQVVNTAAFSASGTTESSPPVTTAVGTANLLLTKVNSPLAAEHILPGDPITYTLTVENAGAGVAHNVVVTDLIPANSSFVVGSCSPACSTMGTPVTSVRWDISSLNPGASAMLSFQVEGTSGLAVGTYVISNSGSVVCDETVPTTSNQVSNTLDNLPSISKDAAQSAVAPGDTVDYTLTVFNPGASFYRNTGDVGFLARPNHSSGNQHIPVQRRGDSWRWAGHQQPGGARPNRSQPLADFE
jgi:uncharacterized repeat protein (TIGR01451 family)